MTGGLGSGGSGQAYVLVSEEEDDVELLLSGGGQLSMYGGNVLSGLSVSPFFQAFMRRTSESEGPQR